MFGQGRTTLACKQLTGLVVGYLSDTSGAVMFVLAPITAILVLGVGLAVDNAQIGLARTQLQLVADEVALGGAQELRLPNADANALSSALQNRVLARLKENRARGTAEVVVDLKERRALVRIERDVENLLITNAVFGRQTIVVEASARATRNKSPLCLLTLEESSARAMHFETLTRTAASGCAFHSNSRHSRAVDIQGNAALEVGLLCSAGGIAGRPSGSARWRNDCPPVQDPLASRPVPQPGPCVMSGRTRIASRLVLDPGTYCGVIELRAGADVELRPGVYVFSGQLRMFDGSRLVGRHVSLHFHEVGPDHNIVFNAERRAHLELTAPRVGSRAGLLLTGARPQGGSQRVYIASERAPELTGTIYFPQGDIAVGATTPIAERSAFTIVVARSFGLRRSQDLEFETDVSAFALNTHYHLTDIPVPPGLGLNAGSVRLER